MAGIDAAMAEAVNAKRWGENITSRGNAFVCPDSQ